ncbi:MAG: class II fumarate hydratase, partial [Acidobacteria bacterium]|nr:class II fumarate hydratase [Acidobacteriota bacterium]
AVENFPVSGRLMPREFIRALGMIKRAAAEANCELGLLDRNLAEAIARAAREVAEGSFDGDFVVDVYQTGSGTSSNMNANEVIANRAIEILGGTIGSKDPVHPNDHVNMGQSSNDVFPTAIHVSALEELDKSLLPALKRLCDLLAQKASEFETIVKIGRTHLQDAVPIRLGQEFGAFAAQVEYSIDRLRSAYPRLRELAIGGTAVGTGINTPPGFAHRVVRRVSAWAGIDFTMARNPFEALAARDTVVETSGQLRNAAVSLTKIANDIRWMASGPHGGLQEISLPSLQPGSSIMPGKVNPVIPESVMMACATVMGNDVAIAIGGTRGNFELNTMMPMLAHHLLESIRLLANGSRNLADRCISGIRANRDRIEDSAALSTALCTALVPVIGYDRAAQIGREAHATGKTVLEVALAHRDLPENELRRILDPLGRSEPARRRDPPRGHGESDGA